MQRIAQKAAQQTLRNCKPKAGASQGGFFADGTQSGSNGYIFGETPPPPGQKRKWESWEATWYGTLLGSALILGLGLPSRPDSNITTWARKQAKRELGAELEES